MSNFVVTSVTTEEELIQKEEVGTLRFSADDVLTEVADRRVRAHNIERACTLGNAHHGKVVMHFRTADGHLYRLETTVWACDDRYITLKAGATLPVRSVTEIEFI
jgi:hypothetical protein